jgi:hypothetical protein
MTVVFMPDSLKAALDRLQSEINASRRTAMAVQGYSRDEFAEYLDRETSVRAVIDEACRHWISNGSWLNMQPDLAVFVLDRVLHAYRFAGLLCLNGFEQNLKNANEVLEFFLIEDWKENGILRLSGKLIEME